MQQHTALGTLLGLMTMASAAIAQTLPQTPGPKNAITDVPGIEVGHYTATNGAGGMTGTTVIIARGGATAGVTQRGGAPGTREIDLLRPEQTVERVDAIVHALLSAKSTACQPSYCDTFPAACAARR